MLLPKFCNNRTWPLYAALVYFYLGNFLCSKVTQVDLWSTGLTPLHPGTSSASCLSGLKSVEMAYLGSTPGSTSTWTGSAEI